MAVVEDGPMKPNPVTQDEVDEFSVLSQKRHAAAQEAGRLTQEIMPVELKSKKGSTFFSKDEHGRPDASVEGFARLPKVFKKDGVIHPGAASGINDGAGSAVLATRSWASMKRSGPSPSGIAAASLEPKLSWATASSSTLLPPASVYCSTIWIRVASSASR